MTGAGDQSTGESDCSDVVMMEPGRSLTGILNIQKKLTHKKTQMFLLSY